MRPASARPWWLGLAVAALGGLWLYVGLSLPQRAQYAAIGPGMFVTLVGGGLVVLGLLLLVQIARGERFAPQAGEDVLADAVPSRRALATAIAGALVPLVAIRPLGFPLTAALVFALVTRAFGSRRLVVDLALGLALGVACWYGFTFLGVGLGPIVPALAAR